MSISAAQHLDRFGVSVDTARQFIFSNINNPGDIYRVALEYQVSSAMLAEILQTDFRGLTEIAVESFFAAYGLSGISLRSGSSKVLKTSTVDAVEDPFVNLQALRGDNDGAFAMARAFGDFSGDGLVDIFMAPGIWLSTDPVPVEVYTGDGTGNYLDSSTIFQNYDLGGLHPRKALVADFNADGVDDVIIADHGYDAPPFPGASPLVWLSTPEGHERVGGLDEIIGFLHSVTVGDVDRDGDIDAFFTDNFTSHFFLLNDGAGGFTYNTNLVPSETRGKGLFTSELVDVDLDGFLDLIVGGHEYEGADTLIYWGGEDAGFSNERKAVIPTVESGHQIVIDIDVADIDLDGTSEIVLTRVGSPPQNDFYDGFYLQVLDLESRVLDDVTAVSFNNNVLATVVNDWLSWTRMADVDSDGDVDIFFDDQWNFLPEFIAYNDGHGVFSFL